MVSHSCQAWCLAWAMLSGSSAHSKSKVNRSSSVLVAGWVAGIERLGGAGRLLASGRPGPAWWALRMGLAAVLELGSGLMADRRRVGGGARMLAAMAVVTRPGPGR